jgi:hypothetical protein
MNSNSQHIVLRMMMHEKCSDHMWTSSRSWTQQIIAWTFSAILLQVANPVVSFTVPKVNSTLCIEVAIITALQRFVSVTQRKVIFYWQGMVHCCLIHNDITVRRIGTRRFLLTYRRKLLELSQNISSWRPGTSGLQHPEMLNVACVAAAAHSETHCTLLISHCVIFTSSQGWTHWWTAILRL